MKVRAIRLSRSPVLTSAAFLAGRHDESRRPTSRAEWHYGMRPAVKSAGEMVDSKSGQGSQRRLAFSPDGKDTFVSNRRQALWPIFPYGPWMEACPPAGPVPFLRREIAGSGGATSGK